MKFPTIFATSAVTMSFLSTMGVHATDFSDYNTEFGIRMLQKEGCTSRFWRGWSGDGGNIGFYRSQGENEKWQVVDSFEVEAITGNPIVYIQNASHGNYVSAQANSEVSMTTDSSSADTKFVLILKDSDDTGRTFALKLRDHGTYLSGTGCGDISQVNVAEGSYPSDYEYWLLMDLFNGSWGSNMHGGKVGSIKYIHQTLEDVDGIEEWVTQPDEYCVEQHGNGFGFDIYDYPEYLSYEENNRIIISGLDDIHATDATGCRSRNDIGDGSCSLYSAPYPRKFFSCGTASPSPTSVPTTSPTAVSTVAPTPRPSSGPSYGSDCVTFASNEYNAENVGAFCGRLADDDKCCSREIDGVWTFDFDVCSDRWGSTNEVTMCKGSCRGYGSCEHIGSEGASGYAVSFGIGACNGFKACSKVAGNSNNAHVIEFGDYSCTGNNMCADIGGNNGENISIGQGSCSDLESSDETACYMIGLESATTIVVGDGSCIGQSACEVVGHDDATSIEIGNDSCVGDAACSWIGYFADPIFIASDVCVGTGVCADCHDSLGSAEIFATDDCSEDD